MTSAPVFSPLHDVHVAAGAGFTDFAGWQMPVRYSSDLAEHHAVRTAAGIFDLSHMAELRVSGPEAVAFLDYALAGKLSAVAIGQAKYSLILTTEGGIVDDVVVYRLGDDEFLVVANAGNHVEALEALTARTSGFEVTVTDESDDTALIAVQGPAARAIVKAVPGIHWAVQDAAESAESSPLDSLRYYWSTPATYAGAQLLVARTGYTGEDGFELYVPAALASALWADLMTAGAPHGLVEAGLASRDTLRLEAGMPLYGHELGLDTLPAQAGLGRVPSLVKGDFVGRAALEAAAASTSGNAAGEAQRVLVGLIGEGKRAARAGYEIFEPAVEQADPVGPVAHAGDAGPAPVGTVTSGALSPTLGTPIAMAYVDPRFSEPGTELAVDIRGKRLAFHVTSLPFYSRKKV